MSNKQGIEKFVQRFCTWANSCGYPERVSRRLPDALRRFADHVSTQDACVDVVVRTLENQAPLAICADVKDAWVYTANDRIVLGVEAPNWGVKRSFSRDEDVQDLISTFAHFASQYVLRSRIMRAQFALAAVYRVTFDFRQADLMRFSQRIDQLSTAYAKIEAEHPKPKVSRTNRIRQLESWMAIANPLDPHIHRALYQYWRAVALQKAEFYEEAVGALDSAVAVVAEALHLWLDLAEQPSRRESAELLLLSKKDQEAAGSLYALRCGFSAHPPVSKWWDFSEIYDEEVDMFFEFVARLLRKFCIIEHRYRSVEPSPSAWGPWFAAHAVTLLDAVWFTKLPRNKE